MPTMPYTHKMHCFPPVSEFQFLVGKEVSQIAYGPHSVHFHWEGGGQITAEFDYEHVTQDGRVLRSDCAAHAASASLLHRLIHKKVAPIEVQPLCLTIGFDDGQMLRLFSEEGPYECGLIQFTDDLADGYIVY